MRPEEHASSSNLHLFPPFFTVSITGRPINRWKEERAQEKSGGRGTGNDGSVRARRALGPLMFPGGSIVVVRDGTTGMSLCPF